MILSLPALPYAADALEPHYSANTISFHHAKHHNAYVVNLVNLLQGTTNYQNQSLVEIIRNSKINNDAPVFNNAAQVWNHTFFWHSMKPNGGGLPTSKILDKINESFGSYDEFATQFKNTGVSQFGSGWVWLVADANGALSIVKTANAETPFTDGYKPLICADVWEHAYYLDYQNLRAKFLEVFLANLVNWDFALENLDGPLHSGT